MFGLPLIDYSVHKKMVKENCKTYTIGTFKNFVKSFKQYSWENKSYFKYSLFNYKDNCEIHADIFKFNNIGFICKSVFDYRKVNNYIKNVVDYKINIAPSENEIKYRLNNTLKSLCNQLNITLEYKDNLGAAAGRILYKSQYGRLILDDARIEVLNKYKDEPYVLAHELGHYMAIKQREDNTEEGADLEAYKLCCNLLTEEELIVLDRFLKIHFVR